MSKIDLNAIAQSVKVLRGVGLETAADITERLVSRVRVLETIIEATARETEQVHLDADRWVCTNDDEESTGIPWLVMRNNEPIADADTLWEAIGKGLADGK